MTIEKLANDLKLMSFNLPHPERETSGGYCGDLLSWVMGRAEIDDTWFTIMSNQNVAAVAVMADLACIVLTENVHPDPELLEKAKQEEINLLGTSLSTYDAAAAFAALMNAADE